MRSSSKVSTLGRRSMSISNSVSAAGSTPPATPDSDLNPFMPSLGEEEALVLEKFELLGCYTSFPFTVVENGEEGEKGVKVVDPQMNLQLCLSACAEYGIAGLWNDTCICGMELPLPSASPDPFLPVPTSQAQSQSQTLLHLHLHLQEQTQEREPEAGVCNMPCPGDGNQICGGGGGGVEAVVRKRERREEGVRWSVYLNLNLTLLNGDEEGYGNAAARRYTILAIKTGTGTGNATSNSNETTTMGFQSMATSRGGGRGLSLTYLSVVGVVVSAVLLLFL
jgi:hypothetical protein